MRRSIYWDTRFLLLHTLVVVVLVMLIYTMSDMRLYQIATDGFYHTQKDPLYMQPWVWASSLAALAVLFLLRIQGWSSDKLDQETEEGTSHE